MSFAAAAMERLRSIMSGAIASHHCLRVESLRPWRVIDHQPAVPSTGADAAGGVALVGREVGVGRRHAQPLDRDVEKDVAAVIKGSEKELLAAY